MFRASNGAVQLLYECGLAWLCQANTYCATAPSNAFAFIKMMPIYQFMFKCFIKPLHRGIAIRASCFAHALGNSLGFKPTLTIPIKHTASLSSAPGKTLWLCYLNSSGGVCNPWNPPRKTDTDAQKCARIMRGRQSTLPPTLLKM